MRATPLLLAGAALCALAGCDLLQGTWSSAASFTLDRERVPAGQTVAVTFDKLADEDGRRFWLALQRADSHSNEAEGLIPIPPGARTMRLFTHGPCSCEVRVYMEAKTGPSMIVARKRLVVGE
jgi:hypothetical protein